MKSLVITGNDGALAEALGKQISNAPELEIALSAPFNEETLRNISFAQPDFVVCDLMGEDDIQKIVDVCLDTTIVFVSDDSNRSEFMISNFNKKGLYRFINIDKNKVTPKEVLKLLSEYVPDGNDEFFKEVTMDELREVVEKSEEEASNEASEGSMPILEPNPISEALSRGDTKEENNFIPDSELNKPDLDEGPAKVYRNDDDIQNVNQSQVVAIYSKKGGTGKSTIAKEIAHIFSEITLPKKIASKSRLDTCLVDMSFDNGDLRTLLGITSPSPNLYVLMDAIVSRMEAGVPLDRIYFSAVEVKTNFTIKLPHSDVRVVCLNQGEFPAKLAERIMSFNDEALPEKIIKKIIKILKGPFNVVVIDTASDMNDIQFAVLRSASKIIYPMEPNMTDIDNLKTFLDSTKDTNYVANKIIPFINKKTKNSFNQDFLDLYDQVKAIYQDLPNIEIFVPFDTEVININNNFSFYSTGESEFKNGIIRACSKVLPVFKVKTISKDLARLNRVRAQQARAEKKKQAKANAKMLNNGAIDTNVAKKEATDNKAPVETKEPMTMEAPVKAMPKTLDELQKADLSNYTLDDFITCLKGCEGIPLSKKGFPKIFKRPETLNKKVWKKYEKQLGKNI